MKHTLLRSFLGCLFTITTAHAQSGADGFRPLFNGKDLTGWDGNPALWSVEEGCITGKTAGPQTLAYNQFLIWRGGLVKNFELRAKVRQSGNNTGIQYRSKELPEVGQWSMGGYQLDIHPTVKNNAMLYEEKARGIVAPNGQSVLAGPQGQRWLVAQREPVKVDVAEWHEYTIIAQGNHLTHKLDGQVAAEFTDHDEKARALEGLLAFQIHRGPAMRVQIKDVMLKELPAGGVVSFSENNLPAGAKEIGRKKAADAPQPKAAAVTVFPEPDGVTPSPHYRIEVQTGDGWKPSYVYFNPARTDGSGATDQPGRSMSWTTFHTDQALRVRVTATAGSAIGVKVRPSRFGIVAEKSGERSVEFSLAPGQKVSVEFEHAIRQNCFTGPPYGIPCVMDALMVFADRMPAADALAGYAKDDIALVAPGLHAELRSVGRLPGKSAHVSTLGSANGKRVVHFAPGVHDLGYWQVPNSVEHIHLAPGAVVFGALDVLPQGREPGALDIDKTYRDAWRKETLRKEFKLTGAGIFSGAKLPWHLKKDSTYHQNDHWWRHVKLVQLAAENITVRDVTLVDSPYWVLSFLNDADSRSHGRFENFKMVGAWTYNNDGLPVPGGADSIVRDAFIHANDDALKLYQSNARVENCVVWQGGNGAVFQFGWFPKTVRDVRVSNIDVIHNENWYGVSQVNRALINYADSDGAGVIEDVHFDNLVVEGRILRLFGFKAGGAQKIRDFHFKNLSVDAMGAGQMGVPGRNYFIGDISGFHFNGFTVGGEKIATPEAGWLEFAPGAGTGFTFDGQRSESRPSLSAPKK